VPADALSLESRSVGSITDLPLPPETWSALRALAPCERVRDVGDGVEGRFPSDLGGVPLGDVAVTSGGSENPWGVDAAQ
jgi:hypothetical protein